MTENSSGLSEELDMPFVRGGESPRHGFRGDRDDSPSAVPLALSICISREAGARGTAIAKRAGAKMGWQVYTQDLLEYIAHEVTFRQEVFDSLPVGAENWVEERLEQLICEQNLSRTSQILDLTRTILCLGARGEVILLGRGAGCVLPHASTLHVRLVAPLAERIAYMSQWQRLTREEAAERVRRDDQRRDEFLSTHFHRRPGDMHLYDMVLNTSLLGEERSADLILAAAEAKEPARSEESESRS